MKNFNFFIDIFAFFDIYIVETLDISQKYCFISHIKAKAQDKERKMGNTLQRIIYYASCATPIAFTFSIVWCIQEHTCLVPSIMILISIFIFILFKKSFSYALKSAQITTVNVIEVIPKDGWILAYIISYLFPFVSFVIDDVDYLLFGILSVLFVIIAGCTHSATPNPILWSFGYHFYELKSAHGMSGYIYACKGKLCTPKDIKTARRYFDLLLIEDKSER